MKLGKALLNLAVFSCISMIITVVFYFVNVQLFTTPMLSPVDAMFIEGILFLIIGFLFLLGRGGINVWSQRAAILSALTEALSGKDMLGPDETLEKDRWKPKGFTRLALVLILTGVFMILAYFITL
ncbi:hypothetical protein E3J49_08020 [Candidatus Bathyarchaeota archaeon]|nr:MAG: hypothetical protein E3J49_08020 [Candidatus Bathyarchaeota archaeon]